MPARRRPPAGTARKPAPAPAPRVSHSRDVTLRCDVIAGAPAPVAGSWWRTAVCGAHLFSLRQTIKRFILVHFLSFESHATCDIPTHVFVGLKRVL